MTHVQLAFRFYGGWITFCFVWRLQEWSAHRAYDREDLRQLNETPLSSFRMKRRISSPISSSLSLNVERSEETCCHPFGSHGIVLVADKSFCIE